MTSEEIELLTTETLVEELASRFENFFLVAASPRREDDEGVVCNYVARWKADGSGMLEDFLADACERSGLFDDLEDEV